MSSSEKNNSNKSQDHQESTTSSLMNLDGTTEIFLNKTTLLIVAIVAWLLFQVFMHFNPPHYSVMVEPDPVTNSVLNEKLDILRKKLVKVIDLQTSKKDKMEPCQKMFSIEQIIESARKQIASNSHSGQVFYASNQTKVETMVYVAQTVINDDWYTCRDERIQNNFDAYRNCFRSLAIEFHNRLSMRIASHWFTTVSRLQYGFLITTMQSKRDEYLFAIGDIYFQVIEYPDLLTVPLSDEESQADNVKPHATQPKSKTKL